MLIELDWDPLEDDVWFIGDSITGWRWGHELTPFEIDDQYNDLVDLIESKNPTDISLSATAKVPQQSLSFWTNLRRMTAFWLIEISVMSILDLKEQLC